MLLKISKRDNSIQFVTTNPRISKPRVGGSYPPGRANNLDIFKISVNLSSYGPVMVQFDPLKSYYLVQIKKVLLLVV